jgi:hypothetical protein
MLNYKSQSLLPIDKKSWTELKGQVDSASYKIMLKWWETQLHKAEQHLLYNNSKGEWNRGYLAGQLSLCRHFLEDMQSARVAKDNDIIRRDKKEKGMIEYMKSLINNTQ